MTTRGEALVACLMEIERHVGSSGWDQPARLFALVPTAALLEAEPSLAAHLGQPTSLGALSSVEQDGFAAGDDPVAALARISWPDAVHGCAIALERTFLPADAEGDLTDDPDQNARIVATHPRRQDVRVVVGCTRDGQRHGVGRLQSNPDDLLGGQDLVPGLTSALARTLE
ncbi:MAG: PPA1309 family protein [Micropruina sp.]